MSGDDIEKLTARAKAGLLTKEEQAVIASELEYYRHAALRADVFIRDIVKDYEKSKHEAHVSARKR